MEAHERKQESELLARLSREIGREGFAVAGLEAVLAALNERRVETLLLMPGWGATGVTCPSCGWLGRDTSECPVDGVTAQPVADVAEAATQAAIGQSSTVRVLRFHEIPGGHHVAALLRF